MISSPTSSQSAATASKHVVELLGPQAAGRGELGREVLGIEHVEVEVHVHRRAVERVLDRHERLDGAGADHGHIAALERLALGAVEVAHAGEHDAVGRHHLLGQPRVPEPARARQAPCRRGSRWRWSRGVEVAVRVQPQHLRVGAVAGHGGERGERDRALGRQQHWHVARRQGVLDLAAGLEQAAARVAQVCVEGLRARLARLADLRAPRGPGAWPPAAPGRPRPRTAAGVRSEVRQRRATGAALIGPSTGARASRRRRSRPPRRPRWTAPA